MSDENMIVKAKGPYAFFQKDVMGDIGNEIKSQNPENYSMGYVVKVVGERWKALSDEERQVYIDMANEDKDRFERESKARDDMMEIEQEKKRKEREVQILEDRFREREEKVEKKQRKKRTWDELTEEEKERRNERNRIREDDRKEKEEKENEIQKQKDDIKEERLKKMQKRLKFLLGQSDLFRHFSGGESELGNALELEREEQKKRELLQSPAKRRATTEDTQQEVAEMEGEMDENEIFFNASPHYIKSGTMRPYQIEGLNWLVHLYEQGINGILADEMGLGKTLQSISILGYLQAFKNISGPHLIIVPKSTLSNWINEINRWCPSLRPVRFHGTKQERKDLIDEVLKPGVPQEERDWDVVVTSYEICNIEKGAFQKFGWQYLIIDEAHRIKNEASMFSQTIRSLSTSNRLLITGTPLQNNLHELWALLNFLLPDVFSSAEQFDEWFNLDIDDVDAKQRMINQLHKILRPFMLRRLKVDVEKSLPPKQEIILFTGMTSVQRELYRQLLLRDIGTIQGQSSGGRTTILNIVMQLRKCCNHPYLFPGVEDRSLDPMGEHVVENCGKMVLMDKLLRKLKERDSRVLIFSQMTRMLDILEDLMVMRGWQYCRIDGNTSYEAREDFIDAYNAPNSEKFVFLLSTRAGGLGINLQTADTVILYDSDWNPQADLQAQDRCHRIGQKKNVMVYRLVTDHTIEVKVIERAQKKLKLDAMVVQQGRLANKQKMSKDELLDAIRFGADTIFRSKDSMITDEDIDLILEQGKKRTDEMQEKLQAADKGDLLDFKLDGGMKSQVFEGVDYSKYGGSTGSSGLPFGIIDVGKRERRTVQSYAEGAFFREAGLSRPNGPKKVKLPKHLRLPRRMEDWQLFNRDRLYELNEIEETEFKKMVAEDKLPDNLDELQILDDEKQQEKLRLINEGFPTWGRQDYNTYVRAATRFGRHDYYNIALELDKDENEVERYSKRFWEVGHEYLNEQEWERVKKNVEKGEAKIEEIQSMSDATRKFVSLFSNPWEELKWKHVPAAQGKIFAADEDRYLLCLTNKFGYGNWEKIRTAIHRCDRFKFDYLLASLPGDVIGRRCEQLMRLAQKEMIEINKKNNINIEGNDNSNNEEKKNDNEMDIEKSEKKQEKKKEKRKILEEEKSSRLKELEKQFAFQMKALAKTRLELKKIRESSLKLEQAPEASKSNNLNGKENNNKSNNKSDDKNGIIRETKTKITKRSGIVPAVVPEKLMPNLIKLISEAGVDGVGKICERFRQQIKNISKRQIEIKINAAAIKEKRDGQKGKKWYIRPEFEHYLNLPSATPEEIIIEEAKIETKTKSRKSKSTKSNKEKDNKDESEKKEGNNDPTKSSENKEDGMNIDKPEEQKVEQPETQTSTPKKRKLSEMETNPGVSTDENNSSNSNNDDSIPKKKRKIDETQQIPTST